MRIFLLTILSLIISASSFAKPKHIELWFLSIDRSGFLREIIPAGPATQMVAALQCQKMGEYCFDPQVGLYKPGGERGQEIEMSKVEDKNSYDFIAPHEGADRGMIECDENPGFFDIFCGKSKKKKLAGKTKLEVWVDVSSTMKQVDFMGFDKECRREMFLRSLAKTCPLNEKMKVYSFEETRKEVGAFDRVCLSGGLNKMSNIIRDLKASTAGSVIIITDIFEAEEKFIDAIESMGNSVIRGLKKPMYSVDLKQRLQSVRKLCK